MTFRCPFCGATLATGRRWHSYGEESGGIFTSQKHECAGCGAVIAYETVSKVFALREMWRLATAPLAGKVTQCTHPRFAVYQCARCASGSLVPAVPLDAAPEPPGSNQFADRERWRDISYLCQGCSARYLRYEHGRDGAIEVSGWSWLVEASARGERYESMPDAPRQLPNATP